MTNPDAYRTLFLGLSTVSFRFDPGPATRLEFDRGFAVQHADYVAHSPIWQWHLYLIRNIEIAGHPVTHRELNRFHEMQKDSRHTHVYSGGADCLPVLIKLNFCSGCDQEAHVPSFF